MVPPSATLPDLLRRGIIRPRGQNRPERPVFRSSDQVILTHPASDSGIAQRNSERSIDPRRFSHAAYGLERADC
jgi:hypothetical protein